MEFSISVVQGNIVLGKVRGTIKQGERSEFIRTLKTKCEEEDSTKAIIDLLDSKVLTDYVEDFNFGTYISKFMSEISIALVSSQSGRTRFVTDVVAARGHNTEIFKSQTDALLWLENV